MFRRELGDRARLRDKVMVILAFLVGANIAAWSAAFYAFFDHPVLLGTALLAYALGLRHAVDADHIAAIDNVTRKLMQQGQRPVGVGLFFSLGHSTVVVLASAGIAATATALQGSFAAFREVGGIIGTGVSTLFLFVLAIVNLVILCSVYRTFRRVRRGGALVDDDLDRALAQPGLPGRALRPLYRVVTASWHMYPLGFLFGLGFDTATEIGLLAISAAEASRGLSIWTIMVFPALFTAGMSLVDTLDGVLMLGAYGWAFAKPIRKLYYNLTITFISVVVAVGIGGLQALNLLTEKLNLEGSVWSAVGAVNQHFGVLGYLIVVVFAASWLMSIAVYRLKRFEPDGGTASGNASSPRGSADVAFDGPTA